MPPTTPTRWTLSLSVALFAAAGCATTAPVDGTDDPLDGLQRAVIDVTSGELLDRAAAVRRLTGVRHVYVGERHTSEPHHRVQLEVATLMQRAGVDLVIGIEWLPEEAQPAIDAWFTGEIDEEEFLTRASWRENWGHTFDSYAPILRWARRHGVPVWALNAPNRLARAVARHGPEGVPEALKPLLPPLDTGNPAHRKFFEELMARVQHGHRGHSPHRHHHHRPGHGTGPAPPQPALSVMERYYLAQLVRDEAMSRNLGRRLQSAEGEGKVALVFAGGGHIDHGHGVPSRAQRLLGEDFLIVLPIENGSLAEHHELLLQVGYPAKRADLLWEAPPVGDVVASGRRAGVSARSSRP